MGWVGVFVPLLSFRVCGGRGSVPADDSDGEKKNARGVCVVGRRCVVRSRHQRGRDVEDENGRRRRDARSVVMRAREGGAQQGSGLSSREKEKEAGKRAFQRREK